MLKLKERNGKKHIVSDEEEKAFAWAGYYANHSNILINGIEYNVVYKRNCSIVFDNGTFLPFGSYVVFKSDNENRFYDEHKLQEVRNNNPLKEHFICFNDEIFLNKV